jgi:hypothetical protein
MNILYVMSYDYYENGVDMQYGLLDNRFESKYDYLVMRVSVCATITQ